MSVSVCVSGYLFYSCALCTRFTAKYTENAFYANICTKKVQLFAEVRFDGACGMFGVRVANVINSDIKCAIN